MNTSAPKDYETFFKTNAAIRALANFIFNEYAVRDTAFCTSWTTYAICATEEEMLLDAAFLAIAQFENPDVKSHNKDYIRELPELIVAICTYVATNVVQYNAAKKFLADAMSDMLECHVRENDPSYDVYDEAA